MSVENFASTFAPIPRFPTSSRLKFDLSGSSIDTKRMVMTMKIKCPNRIKFNPIVSKRRGAIGVAAAVVIPVLIAMLAFAVDCGFLLKSRADLQRSADAAALAAVRDLVPDSFGNQDLDAVRARVREYAANNLPELDGFDVLDADIEIGRYEPSTIYSNLTLLDSGIYDTVRVTLRRDGSANDPVTLFFGGIFGILDSDVRATGTAVLQKGQALEPGAGVLPFSIPQSLWTTLNPGERWNVYGDGRIRNEAGTTLPGNWGTLNLGTSANSTATLSDQVLNGLQQVHLDALYSEGRIPNSGYIDNSQPFYANGDQGLSGGMKHSLQAIEGQTRLVPIYDVVYNHGSNLEFHIVDWAVAVVVDSRFNGANNTYVTLEKSYTYDAHLRPSSNLGLTDDVIEGAYTSPALVE